MRSLVLALREHHNAMKQQLRSRAHLVECLDAMSVGGEIERHVKAVKGSGEFFDWLFMEDGMDYCCVCVVIVRVFIVFGLCFCKMLGCVSLFCLGFSKLIYFVLMLFFGKFHYCLSQVN